LGNCSSPDEKELDDMDKRELNDEHSTSNEPANHAMRHLLPGYATVVALGRAPQAVYPELAAHLADCPICRAELTELLEITMLAYTGQIAAETDYPPVDLSFLPAPAEKPAAFERRWLVDSLGRLVINLATALLGAAPPPLAGATRGRLLYRYVQEPGSVHDLDVTIEVFAIDALPGQARVQVVVEVSSRAPLDQIGSRVVLRADGMEWQDETDEAGCAEFAPIPLDALQRMRVEITPIRQL
jgi:hypothetical protein